MDENHASPWPTPSAEYLAAVTSVENRTHMLFRLIDPPHEVQQRNREFIASVRWTYATTMKATPHEYVVRAKVPRDLRDAYDSFWHAIQEHGYRGRFARQEIQEVPEPEQLALLRL